MGNKISKKFVCPINKKFPNGVLAIIAKFAIKQNKKLAIPFWLSCKYLYQDLYIRSMAQRIKMIKSIEGNLLKIIKCDITFIDQNDNKLNYKGIWNCNTLHDMIDIYRQIDAPYNFRFISDKNKIDITFSKDITKNFIEISDISNNNLYIGSFMKLIINEPDSEITLNINATILSNKSKAIEN